MDNNKQLNLLDLPWNDIIVANIMPFFSAEDWANFRVVSRETCELTNQYFQVMKKLNYSKNRKPSILLYKILTNHCRQLKYLDLSNCTWVTDAAIKEVFSNNHELRQVNLTSCLQLKNGCLQPLAIHCKKLEGLILKNCKWVTIGAVETLAFHNKEALKVVDFSDCIDINEKSLILFIGRHPSLISLSLANVSCVTDKTLYSISQFCQSIQHLNVTGCPRVTDNGIGMIATYCHCLKFLQVNGCQNVTEKSLSKLRCRVHIDRQQKHPHFLRNSPRANLPVAFVRI